MSIVATAVSRLYFYAFRYLHRIIYYRRSKRDRYTEIRTHVYYIAADFVLTRHGRAIFGGCTEIYTLNLSLSQRARVYSVLILYSRCNVALYIYACAREHVLAACACTEEYIIKLWKKKTNFRRFCPIYVYTRIYNGPGILAIDREECATTITVAVNRIVPTNHGRTRIINSWSTYCAMLKEPPMVRPYIYRRQQCARDPARVGSAFGATEYLHSILL